MLATAPSQAHSSQSQGIPTQRAVLAMPQSAASPTAHSVEPSEASYSSSTSSIGRSKSHAAKDHKAAVHTANDRLQKAIQAAAKKKAASGAASPSGGTPGSTAAHDASVRSSADNTAQSPSGSTQSVDHAVAKPSDRSSAALATKQGSDADQAMSPSRLHKTRLDTPATSSHSLPNTASEASVLSAESDDDADFLTGKS